MSEARGTGASESQIEEGAKRYRAYESSDPDTYRPWEKLGHGTQECLKEIAEEVLSGACPKGAVIAEAADVAVIERAYRDAERWRIRVMAEGGVLSSEESDLARLAALIQRAKGGG